MSLASYHKQNKQQRGAALILALVVVTIVVIVAASITSDFLLILRRVENQLQSQQAYAYLRGAEIMARQVLITDFEESNQKDHLSEPWLEVDQEVPLSDEGRLLGMLRGRLSDLQGRFNLNDLPGDPPQGKTFTPEQEQFRRLLLNLDLPEKLDEIQAAELTRSVVDWIDTNKDPFPGGGAENSFYSSLELPMQAGNSGRLYSTSELLWVKDMTNDIYQQLKPLVTAMVPEGAGLNVNTASAEVLAALADEADGVDFEQLIIERDGEPDNRNQGYESEVEFKNAYKQLTGADPLGNFQVKSDYFLLTAETLFLDRVFTMRSVLKRGGDGSVKVIARSYTDI